MLLDSLSLPMDTAGYLKWAVDELRELGEDEALASAEVLLAEVSGRSRISLRMDSKPLSEGERVCFRRWVSLRRSRVPVAHIVGHTFWMEEKLFVTNQCLIPRPETEVLAEFFSEVTGWKKDQHFSFLDWGTGSGAIAVSLLRFFSKAKGTLLDISREAIEIARKNVEAYGLQHRAECVESRGFQNVAGRKWDVIVSNPPYIPTEDIPRLSPEVQKEPWMALDGGKDGLFFYRLLARESQNYLNEGGSVWMEVGQGQAVAVRDLFEQEGFDVSAEKKDLLGISRAICAKRRSPAMEN